MPRAGTVIGASRYHGYDEEASEVEIGWTFLARSHWGGRYNGQLKQLMLEHAFHFVNRVVFLCRPAEPALAAGGREDRRCARGIEVRRRGPRKPSLPDHNRDI